MTFPQFRLVLLVIFGLCFLGMTLQVHAKPAGKSKATKASKAAKAGKSAGHVGNRSVLRTSVRGRAAAAPRHRMVKRGGRLVRVAYAPRVVVPAKPSIGKIIGLRAVDDPLDLRSSVAVVVDDDSNEVLFEKNQSAVLPIASITKLMTAIVTVDGMQPMNELVEVTEADFDTEKHSRSRLRPGVRLTRAEMLQLALMASENRAANSLGRNYPGGLAKFVEAMNLKAKILGMTSTRFNDPTGLSSANVSSGLDLVKLVKAAASYPLIRKYSTAGELTVDTGMREMTFRNTNRLIEASDWQILVSKTGYISEAGNCLVMQAKIDGRPTVMVLLDAEGRSARFGDAQRLRQWLETVPLKVRHQPRQPAPIHARAF